MARPLTRGLGRAVLVTAATVAAAACSMGDGAARSPDVVSTPYGPMSAALCTTAVRVADGDPVGARRTFYDGAHQPLHQLAADATNRDRATAGRLHEAKWAVEASLDDPGDLDATVDRLLLAVQDALQLVDAPALPCTTSPDAPSTTGDA